MWSWLGFEAGMHEVIVDSIEVYSQIAILRLAHGDNAERIQGDLVSSIPPHNSSIIAH